ncbi:MAG: SRPBCC family protein, partial [Fibrobacter sp.]|nr:SRPBCC family protein [Fibrobacter sp.]
MSQKISCERNLGKPIRNAKIWDQIRSYHKYSEFVPCIESIIQENSCPSISEWIINIDGAPLSWQQLDSFESQNGCLKFELTNGDFDQLYGQWNVEPTSEPNQFRISLQLEYSLGIPVIEDILGNIIQEKLTSFTNSMVEAHIKKIEESYVDERKFKRLIVGSPVLFTIDNQKAS